jgi:hypothetical protein
MISSTASFSMMFQLVVIFGRNSFRSIGELQGFWKSGLMLLWMKLKNDVRWAKRILRVWGLTRVDRRG